MEVKERDVRGLQQRLSWASNSPSTAAGTHVLVPLRQRCETAQDRLPLATELCLWQPKT